MHEIAYVARRSVFLLNLQLALSFSREPSEAAAVTPH